jgi:mRNA interferase RelE/StbE
VTRPGPEEPYTLDVARSAARAIAETLPPAVASSAVEFITGRLLQNPHRLGAPLENELAGSYGARLGPDYRVVYDIDDDQRVVKVLRIGRRADIYRST